MARAPKIVIADDEAGIRRTIQAVLEPEGYAIRAAEDGAEAWDLITADPPDVILTDLTMPRLSGHELIALVRKHEPTRHTPVVVISAERDRKSRVKAYDLGADEFVTKPPDATELKARVRALLKVKAYQDHMEEDKRELELQVALRTREVREAFQKTRAASLEAVYRLAKAAEYRDKGTGDHIKRMSHYAAALARTMGHNENIVEALLYASPMHDIGKIGIPDTILLKPGPFTPEEWAVMQRHPAIGANILEGSDSNFIRMGAVIALTHHEKWDGSGYPHGLAGDKIPAVGRISAVADVFDAMSTDRPYREAPFTVEQTVEYIKQGRGTHFDPRVVDAFLRIISEILDIRAQYHDGGH
ncbi:MAG TPA: HD domain-containing phosphohydrolase [Candidatus Edwardsbacteria bacterium]|nr:HD domain-containing phosphohydrolase [Candidatus Edwardsbacteria bacterium]